MSFITRGFNEANMRIFQKICRVWNQLERIDKKLRGRRNGAIGGYHKWLKVRVKGIAWLKKLEGPNKVETEVLEESKEVRVLKAKLERTKVAKDKLKGVITWVRQKCDRLKDINMSTVEALEQEMKKPEGKIRAEKGSNGLC